MLPPVEESVLKNNPQFAALHNTLSTAILNPDGSTKNDPAARERDAIRKKLDNVRLVSAKQHLLIQAISAATPPEPKAQARRGRQTAPPSEQSSELPEPLMDLLLLLPPFLSGDHDLSAEDTRMLLSSAPFSSLPELLPELASLVSANLNSSAVLLARIANPTTNSSFIHRTIPSLPTQVHALAAKVQQEKTALSKARLAAANSLITLLQKHTQALALLIRALEAKHGVVARSLELRAAEVALRAQRCEVDAETALWSARRDVYTPDAARALRNYVGHLRDGQMRLFETIRTVQAELEAYGVAVEGGEEGGGGGGGDEAKERAMRQMATVYGEMVRQMDELKGDLKRLGKA